MHRDVTARDNGRARPRAHIPWPVLRSVSPAITLQTAVDGFLSSPRCENPNTRRV
jgi:hypothetical protein